MDVPAGVHSLQAFYGVRKVGGGGTLTYWVFAAGLTDVEVELTVTDTERDERVPYFSPLGQKFQPITDTSAFSTCP